MRQALILLVMLAVSACDTTSSLSALKSTDLSGNSFNAQLARLYRDLASKEVEKYNWWISKRFADKGLSIAQGDYVEPEDPADWDISGVPLEELSKARETLVAALSDDAKQNQPEQAAKAQFGYDCWVRLEEDGWKDREIAACKQEFETAMATIGAEPTTAVAGTESGTIDATDTTETATSADTSDDSAKPAMGGPLNTSLLFFFDWDSSKLDKNSEDELKDIVADIKKTTATNSTEYDIVINGHADKTGTDEYNMELSRKRAEYVSRYMAKHGIPESRITYYAFGKSDPLVNTADGVKERKNRRVEIFLE